MHNIQEYLFVWVSVISPGSVLKFVFAFYQDWVLLRVQHQFRMKCKTVAYPN